MFFKGKIKIELDNNFEEHFLMQEAEKYVDSLTKKFNSAKKDLKVYFYFKKMVLQIEIIIQILLMMLLIENIINYIKIIKLY